MLGLLFLCVVCFSLDYFWALGWFGYDIMSKLYGDFCFSKMLSSFGFVLRDFLWSFDDADNRIFFSTIGGTQAFWFIHWSRRVLWKSYCMARKLVWSSSNHWVFIYDARSSEFSLESLYLFWGLILFCWKKMDIYTHGYYAHFLIKKPRAILSKKKNVTIEKFYIY